MTLADLQRAYWIQELGLTPASAAGLTNADLERAFYIQELGL